MRNGILKCTRELVTFVVQTRGIVKLQQLTTDREKTLHLLVDDLKRIRNIAALVLGGSHAAGGATEKSDLDIGIYYFNDQPFDIGELRQVAASHVVEQPFTLTGYYEWGPWVNGGAWLTTATGEVDLLYKNIEQVKATIARAQEGVWENHFEQQPPFGFSSLIFLGETKVCIPLYDPANVITELKAMIHEYPVRLRKNVIQQSLWSAAFTLFQATKFAAGNDIYNVSGCLTRATKNIVDALFALNEWYPLGDKRAIQLLDQAPQRPAQFASRVAAMLCIQPNDIKGNVTLLQGLFDETVALAPGLYKPYYQLT